MTMKNNFCLKWWIFKDRLKHGCYIGLHTYTPVVYYNLIAQNGYRLQHRLKLQRCLWCKKRKMDLD